MNLNPQQKKAVFAEESHVLVVAGAGAGKTTTICERVAELIRRGHAPSTFLLVTFTRFAATEMKARLARELPEKAVRNLRAGTFHSVCLDIVREIGELAGYRDNLSIYDETDTRDILKSIKESLGLKVSLSKCLMALEASAAGDGYADTDFRQEQEARAAVREYRSVLRQHNALDYDSLLELAVRLLEESPQARQHYRNKYRHIFADELQDTNPLQFRFLRAINPETLFLVGDFRQSIYGFRGARPQLLFEFSAETGASRYELNLNYRSLPAILELANQIIPNVDGNLGADLQPVRLSGNEVQVEDAVFEEVLGEAQFIADRIKWLTTEGGYRPGDIAVLARTNRILDNLAGWMRDSEQPFPFIKIGSQRQFWRREEIKLCTRILRLLENPHDNQSLKAILRTLKIEIPDLKMAEWRARKEQVPLIEFLAHKEEPDPCADHRFVAAYVAQFGLYEKGAPGAYTAFIEAINAWDIKDFYAERNLTSRVANIDRAGEIIRDKGFTVREFLDWQAFLQDQDEVEDARRADKVNLLTVHSAKGLEWPCVVVCGLQDGVFPHKRGLPDEERRLFYVACTRAENRLILTASLTDDRGRPKLPSEFMNLRAGAARHE